MVRKEFCIGVRSKVAWLQGFKNTETDNKIMHQQLLFEQAFNWIPLNMDCSTKGQIKLMTRFDFGDILFKIVTKASLCTRKTIFLLVNWFPQTWIAKTMGKSSRNVMSFIASDQPIQWAT